MIQEGLDLYMLDSSAKHKAVVLGRRGPDIAVEQMDVGPGLNNFLKFSDRIEAAVLGATRPSAAELDTFGEQLFDYVFNGKMHDLYLRSPPGRISLQIITDHAGVHRVPWEYMKPRNLEFVPDPMRCVVRVLPMCAPPGAAPPRISKKLRILLAVADPVNQPGVGWADVEAGVRRPLEAQLDPVATLKIIPAATPGSLFQAINAEQFDVFHFLGHGAVVNGVGHLVLVDADTRQSQYLPASDLALALSGQDLRLCILSACLSSVGNQKDDFESVATALIRAGIPAVVANQASIPTKSIAPFVGALYARLLRDGNIDNAVMSGRVALQMELRKLIDPNSAVIEWGIPTLFRLPGHAQLFDVRAQS